MEDKIKALTEHQATLEARIELLKDLMQSHITSTNARFEAVADWMEAEDE